MNETEQLIRQAARELGIEEIQVSEIPNCAPASFVAEFARKDGSRAQVQFSGVRCYAAIFERLNAERKSEVSAATAKAKRIAELEAELKELKGE